MSDSEETAEFGDLVRLSYFSGMAKDLASARSINQTLRRIMHHVGTIFAPTDWSLLLRDRTTGDLRFTVVTGGPANSLMGKVVPRGRGIAGWIAEKGLPVIVEDVTSDERFDDSFDRLSGFRTKSVIGVPLKTESGVFGVIELINALEERAFTRMELQFLTAIGEFGAVAIERAYYLNALRRISETDALTGLLNRRSVNRAYNRERERLDRTKRPFSILVIDMDRFKEINDSHGHAEGDRVLQLVAEVLRKTTRKVDVVGRHGGDEFVVLLPDSEASQAEALRERLQVALEAATASLPYRVRASIGIHEARPDDTDPLGFADLEMYGEKRRKQEQTIDSLADNLEQFLREEA